MVTRKRRQARHDSGPNLTPMVDVVLVVLIFLMLAGAIAAPRVLSAPTARSGPTARSSQMSMDLRVQDDPATGEFIVTGMGLRIVGSSGQLFSALQSRFVAYQAAGIKPSDVQVVIRPSGNVKYQHVLTVYETVERAHFTRAALGTTR
jgi:biopolymer transport protein ExbD